MASSFVRGFCLRSIQLPARGLHSSHSCAAGQKVRIRKGQARSGTEHGSLTDLPDWSYLDGDQAFAKLTPAQKKRIRQQERHQDRIQKLLLDLQIAKKD
eukprot:gene9412-1658_t